MRTSRVAGAFVIAGLIGEVFGGAGGVVGAGAAPVAASVASPVAASVAASVDVPRDQGSEPVELILSGVDDPTPAEIGRLAGADVEVVATIGQLGAVKIAVDPDDVAAVIAGLDSAHEVGDVSAPGRVTAARTPTDPGWARQFWMPDQGFTRAWDRTVGSSNVVIATVDTGVNTTPDLAGRVIAGADFTGTSVTGVGRDGDNDPQRHGTLTAELAAAAGDDGYGIAGACWTCRVLPVKVLDADGEGDTWAVGEGIVYAVDHGAHVINLSLGGATDDPVVQRAVRYAESRNVVVVAAAGNDYDEAGSAARYPAAYPTVVGVGAYTRLGDGPPSTSQRGPWYELAAGYCRYDRYFAVDNICGTSFSAPYVSGTVGLMRSLVPDASAAQYRAAMYNSAVAVPSLTGSGLYRYGALSADGALTRIAATVPAAPVPAASERSAPTVAVSAPAGYSSGTVTLEVSNSDDVGVTNLAVYVGDTLVFAQSAPPARFPVAVDTTRFADGVHRVAVVAYDAAGNWGGAETAMAIDNHLPIALLYSPGTSTTVRRHLDIGVYTTDGSGIMGTFLIVNDQVVGGYVGSGFYSIRVPIRRNGRYNIVALTVDNAGRISASNWSRVNGRTR
ncbi:MAG TPA: S8 family serine peptidase [Microthrixaceae bacterium]|nr:S8 family serine peptidase [Microthrixaceae bacterium]